MRIAALLTCFNRKEKTSKCLYSLFQILPDCDVYLVDDASTDGTSEMIKEKYSQVHLIYGNGNLFWSRGMYTAWKEALKKDYDYYLWLNDDIELYSYFFEELMLCNQLEGENCIVSGLIESFGKKEIIYGGSNSDKKLIQVNTEPQEITFMNGNVVLVPKVVVNKIGIIDRTFHHDLGDVDYGLTARKQGIRVVSTRIAIAAGCPNKFCRVRKWGTNIINRFKQLNSPLGSNLSLNFYFRRKHFGLFRAILFCIHLIVLNLLSDWVVVKFWGDTYRDE